MRSTDALAATSRRKGFQRAGICARTTLSVLQQERASARGSRNPVRLEGSCRSLSFCSREGNKPAEVAGTGDTLYLSSTCS